MITLGVSFPLLICVHLLFSFFIRSSALVNAIIDAFLTCTVFSSYAHVCYRRSALAISIDSLTYFLSFTLLCVLNFHQLSSAISIPHHFPSLTSLNHVHPYPLSVVYLRSTALSITTSSLPSSSCCTLLSVVDLRSAVLSIVTTHHSLCTFTMDFESG